MTHFINQSVSVSYMHGLGNQFMVIDLIKNHHIRLSEINFQMIEKWLNQSKDYKIDQILILDKPSVVDIDFNYHIINCDGSVAEQCGNGARCIAKFIHDRYPSDNKSKNNQYSLQTDDGKILQLQYFNDHKIKVILESENFLPAAIGLNINQVKQISSRQNYYQYPKDTTGIENHSLAINFYAVSVGNPHLVIEVYDQDFENFDIKNIGQLLQSQKKLFKNGVNVNFVEIVNRDEIKLRTYERGAGETLACGSGACASFAALKADNQVNQKITIQLPLGSLELSHLENKKIEMIGPATFQATKTLWF